MYNVIDPSTLSDIMQLYGAVYPLTEKCLIKNYCCDLNQIDRSTYPESPFGEGYIIGSTLSGMEFNSGTVCSSETKENVFP